MGFPSLLKARCPKCGHVFTWSEQESLAEHIKGLEKHGR